MRARAKPRSVKVIWLRLKPRQIIRPGDLWIGPTADSGTQGDCDPNAVLDEPNQYAATVFKMGFATTTDIGKRSLGFLYGKWYRPTINISQSSRKLNSISRPYETVVEKVEAN